MVVVSDGPLDLGAPEDSFCGLSKDEIDEQLLRSFLPTDKVVIEQNIPLLTRVGKGFCSKPELGRSKCLGRIPVVCKPASKKQELIQGRLTPSYVRIPTLTTSAAFVRTKVYRYFPTRRFI